MALQGIKKPIKPGQESGGNVGQIAGTLLGGAAGAVIGGPAGAVTGAGLGSGLGSAVGAQVKPGTAPEQMAQVSPMERRQQEIEQSPQMQLLMAQKELPNLPPELRAQAEEPLKIALARIQQMQGGSYGA